MALTRWRDLDTVVAGFADWLSSRLVLPVEVTSASRPTDGWSSETVLIRVHVDDRQEEFAVRLPPSGDGIFPTYDLRTQAHAQRAAPRARLPVPTPEIVEDDRWLGSPFLVMPLVPGHVPGEVAALDPWVQDLSHRRRRRLYDGVVDALAALHRLDPTTTDARELPRRGNSEELAWWTAYLDWCGAGPPVLATALRWCTVHRPQTDPPPVVLWGDVRLGMVPRVRALPAHRWSPSTLRYGTSSTSDRPSAIGADALGS